MAQYRTCPECGAHLDPGEKCDCHIKREESQIKMDSLLSVNRDGHMFLKEVVS